METWKRRRNGFMKHEIGAGYPHALLVCRIAHFVILASEIRNKSIAFDTKHFLMRHTVLASSSRAYLMTTI
jgi:hypothetical protein